MDALRWLAAALALLSVAASPGCFAQPPKMFNLPKLPPIPGGLPPFAVNMAVATIRDYKLGIMEGVRNKTCLRDLQALEEAVLEKERWALKMLDSSEKIPIGLFAGQMNFLGNFDECNRLRQIPTKTGHLSGQYCLINFCLSKEKRCRDAEEIDTKDYYKMLTDTSPDATLPPTGVLLDVADGLPVRMAVCVPSSCPAEEVQGLVVRALAPFLSLADSYATDSTALEHLTVEVPPEQCRIYGDMQVSPFQGVVFAVVMAVVFVVAAASVYDLRTSGTPRNECVVAISAYTSAKRMFAPDASLAEDEPLRALRGIRVLSVVWILVGHRCIFSLYPGLVSNPDYWIQVHGDMRSWLLKTAIYCVDSFLVMGGTLVSFNFFNNYKSNRRFIMWKYLIRRLVRLYPLLLVVMLLQEQIVPLFGDGPLWRERMSFNAPWLSTIFLFNNFVRNPFNALHYWYVATDMQLTLLAPLFLFTLRRNPRRALQAMAVLLWVGFAIRFIISFATETTLLVGPFDRSREWANKILAIHSPIYTRFSPYIMGIALGYFLHHAKENKPPRWISKSKAFLLWLAALALLAISSLGLHFSTSSGQEYDYFWDSLFTAGSPTVWSAGVCLIIYLSSTGFEGPIGRFLTSDRWRIPSQFTYAIYLLHVPIILFTLAQMRTAPHFSLIGLVSNVLGEGTMSVLLAICFNFLFEQPPRNIVHLLQCPVTKKEESSCDPAPTVNGKPGVESTYIMIQPEDEKARSRAGKQVISTEVA